MTQAKGSRGALRMAIEKGRFGEAPLSPGSFRGIPFNSSGLKSSQNLNESSVIRDTRNASAPFRGNTEASGAITVPIDQRNFGYHLQAMFGDPVTTTLATPTTLYGGRGVNPHFDFWQQFTNGAFKIQVDSASPILISGVDLSSVTSFEDIADAIQTAIQVEIPTVTVVWDKEFQRFLVQSTTASKIAPFMVDTSCHSLSTSMKLTVTEGAISKGATTLYKHEFKVPQNQPSVSYEQAFTDIGSYHLFTGAKVQSFNFSAQGDGELTASINVQAAKETLCKAPFDTAVIPALPLSPFNNYQAFITQDGAIIGNATQVDIEVDFDLDTDTYTLSSNGFRTGINEGIVKPSGNINVFFEDTSMIEAAIEGKKSAINVSFAQGPHSLAFLMPEVEFERNTPGIDGPKGIRLEMGYKAYYDENPEGTAVKVTLINDVASY